MNVAHTVEGKETAMLTLLGAVTATAPFAVVFALLAWAHHRECGRREVAARQIALTDTIHERLGAVAAPVVRRTHRRWQVRIAVPFERRAMIEALLAIVREAFVRHERDRRSLEIVLTRGLDTPVTPSAARHGVERETLSWT
jgi:hypothetical protein